jgi:hypothetical protein
MKTRPLSRRPFLSSLVVSLILAGTAACGGKPAETAPPPQKKPEVPTRPLNTLTLAGQKVVVLPLTILLVGDSVPDAALLADHNRGLQWADSLIEETFRSRSPDVDWVLPPALRKIAKRTQGMTVDPDHMGQGIMRVPKIDVVPDPLRSSLRTMAAIAGALEAVIPAAASLMHGPGDTVHAELAMVMADVRTGQVLWRTLATGSGRTPNLAFNAALQTVLPLPGGLP